MSVRRADLIASVVLFSVVAGIVGPAVLRAKARRDRMANMNQLKYLAFAYRSFNDMHPGAAAGPKRGDKAPTVPPYLLPYFQQQAPPMRIQAVPLAVSARPDDAVVGNLSQGRSNSPGDEAK